MVEKLDSQPFIKNQNNRWTVWKAINFVFILCPSRGLLKYIKTKVLATYFYFIQILIETFLPYTSLSKTFSAFFWVVIFLTLYFIKDAINWPNFIAWLSSFNEILGNICIINICWKVCEINHNFLIKPGFYITKRSEQKFKYLKKEKTFKMK